MRVFIRATFVAAELRIPISVALIRPESVGITTDPQNIHLKFVIRANSPRGEFYSRIGCYWKTRRRSSTTGHPQPSLNRFRPTMRLLNAV